MNEEKVLRDSKHGKHSIISSEGIKNA